MGLTYDGITYRSLEEQVRYDAEQIQLLKQADVTINESLQTINTEIDGKLTKPANPSADSAVTMLADGTVGTKPLSEIGGGKLYRHKIMGNLTTEQANIVIDIINTSNTSLTENEYFRTYLADPIVASFDGAHGTGAIIVRYVQFLSKYVIEGAVASLDNPGTGYYLNIRDTFKTFKDTVTEL